MTDARATRILADVGPLVVYYTVGSLTTRAVGCFSAAGIGVLGSILDLRLSRIIPGHAWPKLLNTSEMLLYATMGILFVEAATCKIWANFLQLAGITIALFGTMAYSTDFMAEMMKSNHPGANDPKRTRLLAWSIIFAFTVMTALAAVIPLYKVATSHEPDDAVKLSCNWLVPLAVLIISPTVVSTMMMPQAAKDDDNGGGEASGLLSDSNATATATTTSPLLFCSLLLCSLLPVAVIAAVAGIYDDGKCT